MSKSADVTRLFAETKKTFGGVDILVNNAGIYKFTTLEEITEEEFHRQFNTNVLGLLLTTQEAVKSFGANGGSVINIGSAVTRLTPAGRRKLTRQRRVLSTPSAAYCLKSWSQKDQGPARLTPVW